MLVNSSIAETAIPYKKLLTGLELGDGKKKVGKHIYVPIYLTTEKENIDFTKANFRLSPAIGEDVKLKIEFLNKIPIENLTIHDIEYLKEDYKIKLWIPLNKELYEDWVIKNDFDKGTFTMATAKMLFSNYDIEKKRAEYKATLKNKQKK
jgi:hypothetical protein